MANYNPVTKKFTYTAADERLISNARSLFSAIAEYGTSEAKQDATTAYNAAQHVLAHVVKQRNGEAAAKK